MTCKQRHSLVQDSLTEKKPDLTIETFQVGIWFKKTFVHHRAQSFEAPCKIFLLDISHHP